MRRIPPNFLFVLAVPLASSPATTLPELPRLKLDSQAGEVSLQWETTPGQGYQLESSVSMLEGTWQPLGAQAVGTGDPMHHSEPRSGSKSFYRLKVSEDSFSPDVHAPVWQLDAQKDFSGTAEGSLIGQWPGSGITSAVQTVESSKPVLRDGALVFDGQNDHLSFPMWAGGVGNAWTLAVLLKVREGVQDHHAFFGGDLGTGRSLEFYYWRGGLMTFLPGYDWAIYPEQCAVAPNDNWRVMILRYDGTHLKVKMDWVERSVAAAPNATGQTGNFNLGCGYNPATTSSPVSIRYAAYFPQSLSDEETYRMSLWLERKKGGEYPPTTLFYGGGQSNYQGSMATFGRELPAAFGNVSLAFGGGYGGTPLAMWMRDKDDGSGYEVCPLFDLSAAPQNTGAGFHRNLHSGTRVIGDWNLRASAVRRNPKDKAVCLFIQGETDCGNSQQMWNPNGLGLYTLTFPGIYDLADSYGPRSVAWNAAAREGTSQPEMIFIYERIAFSAGLLSALQTEALHRQRKSQISALAQDARYLLVDTDEFPRPDKVHFSNPEHQPDQVPNTGTERFTRAAIRLVNASEELAALSYHARMLAMRAIDSGFILDGPGFAACETFVSGAQFANFLSLVIPTLNAENTIEQERLRRCNLLVHLGDRYQTGFLATTPAVCTATCTPGSDHEGMRAAISGLLAAWNVPGEISVADVN